MANKLDDLHDLLVDDLIALIKNGTAKPADRNVIRQLLKDHGIQDQVKPGSPFMKLTEEFTALPFPPKEAAAN